MRRRWLVVAVVVGSLPPAPARADGEAAAAQAVLARHCAPCHGGGAAAKGGFDTALDLVRLAAGDLIVAGDPDASQLYRRLRDGEMPPRKVAGRPSAAEVDAVRAWIAAGAPVPGQAAPAAIGWAGIDALMAADLAALPVSDRAHARYLGIVHWHDAGRPAGDIARARRAAAKLLASLTWESRLPPLRPVDAAGTVVRVDLRALGWTPALWDEIAGRDPFAVRRAGPAAAAARRATGTSVPYLRIDWLVAAASRPPLYHRILDLPDSLDELAGRLGIELDGDRRGRGVIRAGFARSGVSRHNRIIERHALPRGGYLWRSFDFAGSSGRRNLFEHPLGPGADPELFAADGGEVIFSLPDGMQAYLLVDAAGRRIDRAPTGIVLDPSRADAAVENGISCMGCHGDGVIAKGDELRAHVSGNRAAFAGRRRDTVDEVRALHPEPAALARQFAADRARFAAALAAAAAVDPVEPIDWVARRFETPLDLAGAAAELGVSPDALLARLTPSLRRRLGGLLLPGGTTARDAFEASFPTAIDRLGQGAPLRNRPAAERLTDGCDDGTAGSCTAAGVVIAGPRALDLFRRGCALGDPRGCELAGRRLIDGRPDEAARLLARACAVRRGACAPLAFAGHLAACRRGQPLRCSAAARAVDTGAGVARDRGRAATLRQQACHLGDAASCRTLGLQYRWGDGVPVDWLRSAELLLRACDLGSARACLWH